MKRFVIMIAALAACALPGAASAQLVTQLSAGNASCPYGGVSISVVTALPNTVQTSYVCSGAPVLSVVDADGDVVPGISVHGKEFAYWDGAVLWTVSPVSGDAVIPGTSTIDPPIFSDSSCSTPVADAIHYEVRYGYGVTGVSTNTYYYAGAPVSLSGSCYTKGSNASPCTLAACPTFPAQFVQVTTTPTVQHGDLPYHVEPR